MSPCEAEFRAYFILIQMDQAKTEVSMMCHDMARTCMDVYVEERGETREVVNRCIYGVVVRCAPCAVCCVLCCCCALLFAVHRAPCCCCALLFVDTY